MHRARQSLAEPDASCPTPSPGSPLCSCRMTMSVKSWPLHISTSSDSTMPPRLMRWLLGNTSFISWAAEAGEQTERAAAGERPEHPECCHLLCMHLAMWAWSRGCIASAGLCTPQWNVAGTAVYHCTTALHTLASCGQPDYERSSRVRGTDATAVILMSHHSSSSSMQHPAHDSP